MYHAVTFRRYCDNLQQCRYVACVNDFSIGAQLKYIAVSLCVLHRAILNSPVLPSIVRRNTEKNTTMDTWVVKSASREGRRRENLRKANLHTSW